MNDVLHFRVCKAARFTVQSAVSDAVPFRHALTSECSYDSALMDGLTARRIMCAVQRGGRRCESLRWMWLSCAKMLSARFLSIQVIALLHTLGRLQSGKWWLQLQHV